jgi:protein TonB
VEQPKKPSLGDVHLATPNVNRGGGSAPNEAAPSIDSADATTAGDPLAGIAASNGHQPTAPLPVGGDVKPAQLLKSVPPVYPSNAKTQRVAGDVKIDALIDAAGNVSTTKILSGPVLLHQAAIVAVKQWKYQPAQLDGKPTAMHLTVTVQFRLQ